MFPHIIVRPTLGGFALKTTQPTLGGFALKIARPTLGGFALKIVQPMLGGLRPSTYAQRLHLKNCSTHARGAPPFDLRSGAPPFDPHNSAKFVQYSEELHKVQAYTPKNN
jgi:hypothetical protein